jgi:hypothetical protein
VNQSKVKNVFISHHSKDDQHIDRLTRLLKKKGYAIRNSAPRVKPENQERLDKGLVSDATIKRLLRMKITWAGTVIVLIGKNTHTRPWVNWEIEQAVKKGKNIVGVWQSGLKEKVEIPSALEKYHTSLVGWDSNNIIDAIGGKPAFQNPDGSPLPRKDGTHSVC